MRTFLATALLVFATASPVGFAQEKVSSNEDQALLARAANTFNEVAKRSLPSVVSISAIKRASPEQQEEMEQQQQSMPGRGAPNLFGQGDPQMLGLGSGAIIHSDGYILTNNHVVENAERITVSFDEKTKFPARLVGRDPKTDLAVIQILAAKKPYPIISFGNSDQLQVGDWAIAIGSPFGLNQSVSFGIISAKGRGHMGILDIEDFIQTDAAINPGSSGGPLLNSRGEMIGINTAIFSHGGGFMGIGFAIPSKIAKDVADQLIANGKVRRGWIGLVAQDVSPELATYFKAPNKEGALVAEILPNGPAAAANLKQGDVILKFNNSNVTDATHLKSMVGQSLGGSSIPVEISRKGKRKSLTLALREQPTPPQPQMAGQVAREQKTEKGPRFGLAVDDVPSEVSEYLKITPGRGVLVIGVQPGSPAFEAGLAPGDVILTANDLQVKSLRDFTRAMKKVASQDVTVLYVQRGPDEKIYVPLKGQA